MVNECIIEVPAFANNQRAHPRHVEDSVGSNHMGIGTTVFTETERKLTCTGNSSKFMCHRSLHFLTCLSPTHPQILLTS